jgi:hypothetical protein
MSQDEDLLLMDHNAILHLLTVAAEPDCPKREYIIHCVAHAARDDVFSSLGTARFNETLQRISSYRKPIARTGATDLLSYVERLATYGERCSVDRDGAVKRGLDLTRCGEPDPRALKIVEKRRTWEVLLPSTPARTIVIDKANGRISLPKRWFR